MNGPTKTRRNTGRINRCYARICRSSRRCRRNHPLDAFLAAEHVKHGLTAARSGQGHPAAPRDLDLIGLPPTREELHAFLADPSPDAYEKVVDRLLASPQYGERWGRHWMDVWRYSDWYGSRGINEIRYSQRHIWRWRDWIVESLNADKGYDRMVPEMLAGDELAPGDPDVLRATGFLGRNWYKFNRNVWLHETVEHTARRSWALTLNCCRCHDHKYDPIAQQDYYRFRAFFEPHDVRTDPLPGELADRERRHARPGAEDRRVARSYDKQPDVKTFVFKRGDNRYPDENQLMRPASRPRSASRRGALQTSRFAVGSLVSIARAACAGWFGAGCRERHRQGGVRVEPEAGKIAALQQKLSQFADGQPSPERKFGAVFADRFAQLRPEVWKVATGEWAHEPGKLTRKSPAAS